MNETKEHILKITLSLFLQKNFKEVTMSEIVKKTGLSKGAFYHYFASKEKLFEEVVTHYFEQMLFGIPTIDQNQSLLKFYTLRLNQFNVLKNHITSSNGEEVELFNLNFFSLMFDALKLLPKFQKKIKAQQTQEKEEWKNIIRKARETGEINTSLTDDLIADLFIFGADGLALNRTLYNQIDSLEEGVRTLWNGIYSAIKG